MVKVAVLITTFNLQEYIEEAILSVLNQKTNFEYKIIIGDDCSVDNTISILKKYKEQYPEKIDVYYSQSNNGSLTNSNRLFDNLQCEYFSFLDGDDYWVGEDRLQKQVDFLDSHLDYNLCGGNTQYLVNGDLGHLLINKKFLNKSFSFNSLLNDSLPFVHTSSLLVRNIIFCNGLPPCYKEAENTFENCALRGEDFRRILHLEQGKMYLMDDIISVYRIHEKGVWQGSSKIKQIIESAICSNFYAKYFSNKYGSYFEKKAQKDYRSLMLNLIFDYSLFTYPQLSQKEMDLITSLIKDRNLGDEQPNIKTKSFVHKIIKKTILHFNLKCINFF